MSDKAKPFRLELCQSWLPGRFPVGFNIMRFAQFVLKVIILRRQAKAGPQMEELSTLGLS